MDQSGWFKRNLKILKAGKKIHFSCEHKMSSRFWERISILSPTALVAFLLYLMRGQFDKLVIVRESTIKLRTFPLAWCNLIIAWVLTYCKIGRWEIWFANSTQPSAVYYYYYGIFIKCWFKKGLVIVLMSQLTVHNLTRRSNTFDETPNIPRLRISSPALNVCATIVGTEYLLTGFKFWASVRNGT